MAETMNCPTCQRPVMIAVADRPATFPFCSLRCRQRDLGAWFDGRYVVAGEPANSTKSPSTSALGDD